MAGEELIDDAEQSGMERKAGNNGNIGQVAAVLKDNCRTSCKMMAESTRIPC